MHPEVFYVISSKSSQVSRRCPSSSNLPISGLFAIPAGPPLCLKGVYLLKRLLQHLAWWMEFHTLIPNFNVVALKMWVYSPQNCHSWYLRYKFSQNGYNPLSDFYKIWDGAGSFRSAPSCQISPLWLKN